MCACAYVYLSVVFFALLILRGRELYLLRSFLFQFIILFRSYIIVENYHHTRELDYIGRGLYEPSGELETRAARDEPVYAHTPDISHGGHLCD